MVKVLESASLDRQVYLGEISLIGEGWSSSRLIFVETEENGVSPQLKLIEDTGQLLNHKGNTSNLSS